MQILTPDGKAGHRDVEEERLYRMLLHWTSLSAVHNELQKVDKGITNGTMARLRERKLDKFELSKEVRKILGCKGAVRVIAQSISNLPRTETTYPEAVHGLRELFAEMRERVHAGQSGLILP